MTMVDVSGIVNVMTVGEALSARLLLERAMVVPTAAAARRKLDVFMLTDVSWCQ